VSTLTLFGQFFDAVAFNGNVSAWNTGSVQFMYYTFGGALAFQGGDLTAWDTSKVEDMGGIFNNAQAFNGNISTWDVSKVNFFEKAFAQCAKFDGDLSAWDVSSAIEMLSMFADTPLFSSQLTEWQTGKVEALDGMVRPFCTTKGSLLLFVPDVCRFRPNTQFRNATAFNSDISTWNMSSLMVGRNIFDGAYLFNHSLCAWGNTMPEQADVTGMFANSSCPEWGNPMFNDTVPGPFCHACTET
jgi:Mycoplasma protein of unknown function, DUF285